MFLFLAPNVAHCSSHVFPRQIVQRVPFQVKWVLDGRAVSRACGPPAQAKGDSRESSFPQRAEGGNGVGRAQRWPRGWCLCLLCACLVAVDNRFDGVCAVMCAAGCLLAACQWGPAEPRGGAAAIRRPSRAVKVTAWFIITGARKIRARSCQSGWLFQKGASSAGSAGGLRAATGCVAKVVQETGCSLTYDPWRHRVLLGTRLADGRPTIPRSQVGISTE